MFNPDKWLDRHPFVSVVCFFLFCVIPLWFLLGVNDWVKQLLWPQTHTTTSVVTDTFDLAGTCRERYSTIGIYITGQIQFLAWTSRLNGEVVGEPSPSYSVTQRIRREGNVFARFDESGTKLGDMTSGTVDYDAPDRIEFNFYAAKGNKPNLSTGTISLPASGEFLVGQSTDAHEVSMVCNIDVKRVP